MRISKEVRVGILAIAAVAILYFGITFLKGSDIFSSSSKFYVIFNEIDGLAPSNPVLLNGLPVGRVERITLMQSRGNILLVTLDIDKEVIMRKGAKAVLADGGLLGGKIIKLEAPLTGGSLAAGDTLLAGTQLGISSLIQQKALPVLSHADSLMQNLTSVAEGFKETGQTLNKVLDNFDKIGGSMQSVLGENRGKIKSLLINLDSLSSTLADANKGVGPMLANANNFVDSLKALELGTTVRRANAALDDLEKLAAGLKDGKGSAGKLLKDDRLYNNLNYAIISLNQLLSNFRENPRRYVNVSVFGKKDRGPNTSEVDTTLQFKADSLRRAEPKTKP